MFPSGFLSVPVMCSPRANHTWMYYCPYVFYFFPRAHLYFWPRLFFPYSAEFSFLGPCLVLSPCRLVSTQGGRATTWYISSIILAPTQSLLMGLGNGSIVLLMFSLSVPGGWDRCQVTGAACGSHPGSSAMSF